MDTTVHQNAYEIGIEDGSFIDLSCWECAKDFVSSNTGKQLERGNPFHEDGVFASWRWPETHCLSHKCQCGALLAC